jgi:gamma-glutamylputrescine oxidase
VFATTPLWLEDAAPERPPLDGPADAQACVIGAGIGGLATAWKLLDAGIRPLVLEARTVAGGASGRNGGFFIAGPAPMYHDARARWGKSRTIAIQRATLEAQAEMLAVAEAVGARQHFRMEGMLRLGVDATEAADVRAHHAALRADGFPGELLEGDDLPEALRRPERAGLLLPHDGSVHPVRWLRALADGIERRGGVIHERTRVARPPESDGDGVRVRTEHGEVAADVAVVAMDGGLSALVPAATAVRSRRLNMLATAPTDPRLPFPIYARYGFEYAQQTADGRIALGGFSDLDAAASWTDREEISEPVQRRLDTYLREELGVGAPVTHRWVGVVGYADEAMPRCGPVPGGDGRILALGGYNGTGHIQAWVAAAAVAGHVTGEPPAPLYAPV